MNPRALLLLHPVPPRLRPYWVAVVAFCLAFVLSSLLVGFLGVIG